MGSNNTTPFEQLESARKSDQSLPVSVYGNIPQFDKSMTDFMTQAKLMEDMFLKRWGKPNSLLMEVAPWEKFDIKPLSMQRSVTLNRRFNYLFIVRSIIEAYFQTTDIQPTSNVVPEIVRAILSIGNTKQVRSVSVTPNKYSVQTFESVYDTVICSVGEKTSEPTESIDSLVEKYVKCKCSTFEEFMFCFMFVAHFFGLSS
jgi:hypothetical protein